MRRHPSRRRHQLVTYFVFRARVATLEKCATPRSWGFFVGEILFLMRVLSLSFFFFFAKICERKVSDETLVSQMAGSEFSATSFTLRTYALVRRNEDQHTSRIIYNWRRFMSLRRMRPGTGNVEREKERIVGGNGRERTAALPANSRRPAIFTRTIK